MRKGLIMLTAAAATLGSVAVASPASAQYYGGGYGHHRGYDRHYGDRGDWGRARWHHEREREWRWHHRHHHRDYGYSNGYRGYYGW